MTGPASSLRPLVDCLSLETNRAHARLDIGSIEWQRVLYLANLELVGPALFSRLTWLGRPEVLPAAEYEYLALLHRLNGERNAALRRQADELVSALNGRGVGPVLLKGAAALFADVYGDPAARMIGDLDILVPPHRLQVSLGALAALGYRLADRYPPGHHAYGEFMRPGAPGAIDLHVEPIDAPYLLPSEAMRRRAVSCSAGTPVCFVPSATDRMLHNILHAQIHHRADFYRGTFRLRQLYDGAMIAQALGPAIDWTEIETRLAAGRLTTALQAYLVAAQDLFGLRWPLSGPPTLGARAQYRRCLVQRRVPALATAAAPWANLRHGFAWHRIRDLYGEERGLVPGLWRHARQFARKAGTRGVIAQLFRVSNRRPRRTCPARRRSQASRCPARPRDDHGTRDDDGDGDRGGRAGRDHRHPRRRRRSCATWRRASA